MMGVGIGCGMIATICRGLSVALEQPMQAAQIFARQQPVVYVDETGDSAAMRWRQCDGGNPDGKRGWQWV